MEKRAQGRPSRASGAVGRDKIIEDVRRALRSGSLPDPSRKVLAGVIGVTPALITYYFPEKEMLFEQVAVPIIEHHRQELSRIVNSKATSDQKLRAIIKSLTCLYGQDRPILNIYRAFEAKFPDDYAEIATMTDILADFFAERRGGPRADCFEAVVLQGAVCGMCELAERVQTGMHANIEDADLTGLLEPVFRLFACRKSLSAPLLLLHST